MHDQHDNNAVTGLEIAIVGLAGRFPGAPDVERFWLNIRDGVESVQSYTDAELRELGVPDNQFTDPNYVKAGVPFDGIDMFDAALFDYTPRDAEQLDPQHRIFLECAWEALESAGYDPQRYRGSVGVYAGSGASLYLIRQLLPHYDLENGGNVADLLSLLSGNLADALCTRIAYKLNLRGPAVTVQTACSTSLMAVHTACQALLGHECDMALAGGVSLNLLQNGGYRYQAGAIFSPDGHCRAFDARAAGTLLGSGAGIVVLKRLEDALRDGDTIHAVIKGSAANNDGSNKVGFTAPSVSGQAEVIQTAQALAEVPASTIGYIEAHGTGTTLGDPIEIAALTQAFRTDTARCGFCAVGSVKTNVGHLDAAAGVTGLIKAVLALKHRTLPPSLHFEQPNPQIDFAASPFYINTTAQAWPEDAMPRRAGVSAFGIGGTNVHVVLEEAPPQPACSSAEPDPAAVWQVLPVSARDEAALRQSCERLTFHLREAPAQPLADIAHTLQVGRQVLPVRCAVVAHEAALAAEALAACAAALQCAAVASAPAPEVVFLFPGGGAQHAHMGAALYRSSAYFREQIDTCCELLRRETGFDLRDDLFPTPGLEAVADARLFRMARAQPALFVIEYALARWWMHAGVQPVLMVGHSLGEYVAACLAGVFRLEDALRIVATRGRLMETLAAGAMTAVPLSEAELTPFLGTCDIAAINGERLCVLAGTTAAIEEAEAALRAGQHQPRRLHVSIASHSSLVEPILTELERTIAAVPRHAPRLPFVSNLSGRPITDEEATSPQYWTRHLRGTVRFVDGLREVFRSPGRVLLEVGPGETLASLARQHPQSGAAAGIWASQAHPQQHARNAQQLAQTVAGLWTAGVELDWHACAADGSRRRVPLPTYPFQHRRYWVEAPSGSKPASATKSVAGQGMADWLYLPDWRRTALVTPPADAGESGCVLLLADTHGVGDQLAAHLQWPVLSVHCGQDFARIRERSYTVRPGVREDFERLLREVESVSGRVSAVCHLCSLDTQNLPVLSEEAFERGFQSLLALAQALDATAPEEGEREVSITVVANGLEDVTGTEPLCPAKATLHGMCKVIPLEYPHIACRLVDVVLPAGDGEATQRLARQIAAEMQSIGDDELTAYRGAHRWIKTYEPARRATAAATRLCQQGVYLVTGGFGGVGLALARHLARQWQARLVLLGRSADSPQRQQILNELTALGGEVLPVQADVADAGQMRVAVDEAKRRFGALHGVIHAAGIAGGGVIANRSREAVEKVFAPKLQGSLNVLAAVEDDAVDFVVLCSSMTAITGGFGQADYCAANSFQDALALEAARRQAGRVFSINWDTWRGLGMAAAQRLPDGVGIETEQGGPLLEAVLAGGQAQTLVSVIEMLQQFERMRSTALGDVLLPAATVQRNRHARPVLSTPFVEPIGELEQGLAALWSEFLGIAPIGADDNLFELGGDSLLAIQLLAKVRGAYGVDLHPAAFFKAPTVTALAVLVETRLIEEIEEAALSSGESILASETHRETDHVAE